MANPAKGEVDFVVGERTLILKLGHNARAEISGLMGKRFGDVVAEMDDESFRAVIWAGLRQHQPNLTLIDVGDILDEVGDEYAADRLHEAGELAKPKGKGESPSQAPKSDPAGTSS